MASERFAVVWESYARQVMPKDAGEVQWQETRRAFYAGGAALLRVIVTSLDNDPEPTEDDLRMLDELRDEFEAFTRDVEEGQA